MSSAKGRVSPRRHKGEELRRSDSGAGRPVLREFLESAKGVPSRAAIQERNSAEPERRGAPVLRESLKTSNRKELTERLERAVRQSIASAILFNQKVADDAGINLRDLQVLHLLQLRGPSTPRDLARWACITTGGMTVVLDRLEKGGYARREPNPADRRSSIVHLIPESLRQLEGVYRAKGAQLAGVMAQYGDRELRLFIEFFARVNDEAGGPQS